jgi:hypothetical protein
VRTIIVSVVIGVVLFLIFLLVLFILPKSGYEGNDESAFEGRPGLISWIRQ